MEDNLPSDKYHYQMTVYTGTKKQAGTTSKISFILSGDECDTGVRRLFDGKRKVHSILLLLSLIFFLIVQDHLGIYGKGKSIFFMVSFHIKVFLNKKPFHQSLYNFHEKCFNETLTVRNMKAVAFVTTC